MEAQIIAAALAGFASPFIQEILLGPRVSGRMAVLVNAGISFLLAFLATWVSGGFRDAAGAPAFNFVDPSAFFAFWYFRVLAPVFGLSQFVFNITTKRQPDVTSGPIQSVAERVQDAVPALGPPSS